MSWGATQQEWAWAEYFFGTDILPAVGNPDPNIPRTKGLKHLDSLAKTPSMIGGNGVAHGISGWVVHTATPAQIAQWKRDPDLNILLNTRTVRAIDIDIDNTAAADALEQHIFAALGVNLPVRFRENSGKRTLLLRVSPNPALRKRVVRVPNLGAIEFLANGQQTALFGTHPSGARFRLRHAEAGIPEVPIEKLVALWDSLREGYDIDAKPLVVADEQATEFILRNGGVNSADPVLQFLHANGWVTGCEANGVVNVRCPNEVEHTTQSGGSSTSYLPAGLGNKEHGGFKCLHSHCEHITTPMFVRLIGYEAEAAAEAFTSTALVAPAAAAVTPIEATIAGAITAPRPDALGFRRDGKGNMVKSFANLMEILRTDIAAIGARYDDFTHTLEVAFDGGAFKAIDDDDISTIREIIERRYDLTFSADEVRQAVSAVAKTHRIDSAIAWCESLKWDGVDRISTFAADILHSANFEYQTAAVKYMWVAAAARLLSPGVKADMAVVLISPRQGTGKSSFVKAMSPFPSWGGEMSLAENDADLARLMRGKAVVEIPELKGFNARGAEELKAFLSRAEEEFVPKYKEFAVTFKRRCIFVGSHNKHRFLSDPTGNRRFLPIHVAVGAEFVDWPKMQADLNQYWAQAVAIVKSYPTAHEAVEHFASTARRLAGPYTAAATVLDPWHGTIAEFVARQDLNADISIAALAAHLLPGGVSALDVSKARRIRDTMVTLGLDENGHDTWRRNNDRII